MQDENKVTYFAETDARNRRMRFGIKRKDRSRHMYIIGKTGMGKSAMLENLAVQDIKDGEGLAFIDPHGNSAELLLEYIPEERIKDVLYFAPFDMEYPISFNVMEDVGPERRHLVANGLMSAFKKIWVDAWSARMEYILGNIMLALLEYPGSTLIGVNRMLVDKDFRKKVVDNVSDPSVRSFWVDEYAKYTEKFAAEAAPAIQNKVGQFVANPLVRNIIGQPKSSFDLRKIMDEKKILIINLSKGRVGEANANLLGSMLITKIYLAAMSRADASKEQLEKLPNFYLYVDEFQSFANESFADILSEARKYKLSLNIAHQYIEQMSEEVRAAVFGNVGTMVTFRVGAYDAEVLEKEFAPNFTVQDIVGLGRFQIYLKLMIDGVSSPPFSATTLAPSAKPDVNSRQAIIDWSRSNFARPRAIVEDEIVKWHQEKFIDTPAPRGNVGGGSSNGYGGQSRPTAPQNTSQSASKGSGGIRANNDANSSRQNDRSASTQPTVQSQQPVRRVENKISSVSPQGYREDRPLVQQTNRNQNFKQNNQNDNKQSDKGGYRRDSSNDSLAQSQNRSHSQGPTQVQQNTQAAANSREYEIRKAVSLNYLKEDKEKENLAKNDQKVAKPENVMALREALLGVLKETQADQKKEQDKKDKIIENLQNENEKLTVNASVDSKSSAVVEKNNIQKRAPENSGVNVGEIKDNQKGKDAKKPAEVPEDVLKKILEIE